MELAHAAVTGNEQHVHDGYTVATVAINLPKNVSLAHLLGTQGCYMTAKAGLADLNQCDLNQCSLNR